MGAHKPHPDSLLVGDHRVTLVGLRDALRETASAPHPDREAAVTSLMTSLSRENYIPDGERESYRRALTREYLRHRGEDFGEFLSEIPVTVRGEAGAQLEGFTVAVRAILAEMDLRPLVTFEPPVAGEPSPRLVINDQLVVEGTLRREQIKAAISRSISGW